MSKVAIQSPEPIEVWAAVGPDGSILRSSVGTFQSVAKRWAQRKHNFTVLKLAELVPNLPGYERKRRPRVAKVATVKAESAPVTRRRRAHAVLKKVTSKKR